MISCNGWTRNTYVRDQCWSLRTRLVARIYDVALVPMHMPTNTKSNFCRFYAPHFSFSKTPPFLCYRKQCARLARSAKITMAAPQNPPFLGRVCFPPAENCSDRGAFCARRVEQQVVRAYPSSAPGEHAVLCKCRAKFIKIQGFENEALPSPGHGTHHLPIKAHQGEAP